MRLIAALFLTATLAGCALSPQQVRINPELSPGDDIGAGRPVQVRTGDARESSQLGTRGGVYSASSAITPANDLAEAITRAARGRLAADGFNVNSGESDALEVKLAVEKLRYEVVDGKPALHDVEVEAVLSVQLSREGKSWSGRYQTRNSRSFMTAPDAETNAALINSLLEETLERMFADPEFTAFLTHDGSLL